MPQTYLVPRAVQGDAPERLVAWRTDRKMSQAKLAELLGCSQATVSMVESGERFPPDALRSAAANKCRIPRRAWGARPKRKHANKVTRRTGSRKTVRKSSDARSVGSDR